MVLKAVVHWAVDGDREAASIIAANLRYRGYIVEERRKDGDVPDSFSGSGDVFLTVGAQKVNATFRDLVAKGYGRVLNEGDAGSAWIFSRAAAEVPEADYEVTKDEAVAKAPWYGYVYNEFRALGKNLLKSELDAMVADASKYWAFLAARKGTTAAHEQFEAAKMSLITLAAALPIGGLAALGMGRFAAGLALARTNFRLLFEALAALGFTHVFSVWPAVDNIGQTTNIAVGKLYDSVRWEGLDKEKALADIDYYISMSDKAREYVELAGWNPIVKFLTPTMLDAINVENAWAKTQKRLLEEWKPRLEPVPLPPGKGSVAITSTPAGADVLLEGVLVDITPMTLELDPGRYDFVVRLEGYLDKTVTALVKAGETAIASVVLAKRTEEEELPPRKAKLTVSSVPAARIYVGGRDTGYDTPATFTLDEGTYDITLKREGFYDSTGTVYLNEGDVKTFERELKEIPAAPPPERRKWKVSVDSNPGGAKILVNSVFSGQWTPGYVILYDGTYVIGVDKSGYKRAEAQISLGV